MLIRTENLGNGLVVVEHVSEEKFTLLRTRVGDMPETRSAPDCPMHAAQHIVGYVLVEIRREQLEEGRARITRIDRKVYPDGLSLGLAIADAINVGIGFYLKGDEETYMAVDTVFRCLHRLRDFNRRP